MIVNYHVGTENWSQVILRVGNVLNKSIISPVLINFTDKEFISVLLGFLRISLVEETAFLYIITIFRTSN